MSRKQTIREIIDGFDTDLAMVDICENGVGHVFVGDEDIDCIDEDLLDKPVESFLIVKKQHGFELHVEV